MTDGGEYELSPSGQPVYRHRERSIPFQPAAGDPENIQRIADHIERHLGPVSGVYHEIISDLVHLDVHVVDPSPERNCYTLVTSGMSDAPMTVPEGAEGLNYAELVLQLPATWPLDRIGVAAGKKAADELAEAELERWYWPVRWLKTLARLPHEYDTWLGVGHTVPTADPPEPYADNTRLRCMLVLPAMNEPDAFGELEAGPDKTIHFYSLVAIYPEEMDLKLKKGTDALIELFDKHKVDVVVDPQRPNVAARKKWLGLF